MIAVANDWLERLLDKHSIDDEEERQCWRNLVEDHARPPQGLRCRFRGSPLLHDILEKLSEPFALYYENYRRACG